MPAGQAGYTLIEPGQGQLILVNPSCTALTQAPITFLSPSGNFLLSALLIRATPSSLAASLVPLAGVQAAATLAVTAAGTLAPSAGVVAAAQMAVTTAGPQSLIPTAQITVQALAAASAGALLTPVAQARAFAALTVTLGRPALTPIARITLSAGLTVAVYVPPAPFPVTPRRQSGRAFQYLAYDLLTMEPLDPLPYVSVTFGRILDQHGAFTGSVPITDPNVQKFDYLAATHTGRTLLCVDWLGNLVWGGVIWTRRYKRSSGMLVIGATEVGSYFQQRLQAFDYSTTWQPGGSVGPADPMQIVNRIMTDAQAVVSDSGIIGNVAGGIDVVVNTFGATGAPPVAVSYPATQLQTIDSIVSTLSQMGYTAGFDYSFDVAYQPGTQTPVVTMNLWYPRMGQTAAQNGLIVLGSDLLDFGYDEDSTQQANETVNTGSGTGGIQPVTVDADTPGYPLLQRATSHPWISDEAVLAGIGAGDIDLRAWPVTTPTLDLPVPVLRADGTLDPSMLTFGQFDVGDNAITQINPIAGGGRNVDPRFPDGMEFEWQITQWSCSPAEKGISKIIATLGVKPGIGLPLPPPIQ